MTHFKFLGIYEHRSYFIIHNYGGWVIEGDFNLYKTLADTRNAIDKRHDGSHKAEPRIIRTLTDDEFVYAFSRERKDTEQ